MMTVGGFRQLVGWVRGAGLAGVLAVTVVGVTACNIPSRLPDGSVPQIPPVGLNGLAEEPSVAGTAVWGADYIGHQLVRFDPDSGRITERFGALCDTDDVVVAPDESLIATCAGPGTVVRVSRDGTNDVLAHVGLGVNPIALEPGGSAVVVGFGTDDNDELIRVPLDGGPVQVLADGLPVLNGFSFGPDGRLYVPTGGVQGLIGSTGGLGVIDTATGEFTKIPLTIPGSSTTGGSHDGLPFAVGVDVGADGVVYIAQGMNPAVWAVDPGTGVAGLVGRSPLAYADNLAVLGDGRIILSGFVGNQVVLFERDGTGGWHRRVGAVGRVGR